MCLEHINKTEGCKASQLCDSKDGKLPLPENEKENAEYLNAFEDMLQKRNETEETRVALDLGDVKSEGEYATSKGKSVKWFNWKNGEPSRGGEHYVNMYVNFNKVNDGKWNDRIGSYKVHVFCEHEPLWK